MQHNTTHAEIILDTLITENKTDDSNITIENTNAPGTPANENKQPNKKGFNEEKDENQNTEHKK